MAEDSPFYAGETPAPFASAPPPPPPPAPARYELRPLSTGEILDRTFYLFRNNFWLFTSLAAVAAGAATLSNIAQLVFAHFHHGQAETLVFRNGLAAAISLVGTLIYLVVYSVTQAATVSAVTSIYLGDRTSMKQAFDAVKTRWLRYFFIGIWQGWAAIWLFVVSFIPLFGVTALGMTAGNPMGPALVGGLTFLLAIASLVYGMIAYIRNSMAVPAEVMEGLTVRKAMRRSKDLAAGSKGRIFLLLLFLGVLYLIAGAAVYPFSSTLTHGGGNHYVARIGILFINFAAATLIGPVGAIGLCLFYIDQRVRKEGFDIEFMLDKTVPEAAPEPFWDLGATGPAATPVADEPKDEHP